MSHYHHQAVDGMEIFWHSGKMGKLLLLSEMHIKGGKTLALLWLM